MNTPHFKELLKNPIHLLAFGFGSGLLPIAPGTMGSLAAIPFAVLMLLLPVWAYCGITILVCLTGFYICGKTARDLGEHDHSGIVWDEFAGILISFLPIAYMHDLPHFASVPFMAMIMTGFILFRFFDVLKPMPIKQIDRKIAGGLGIMLDDMIAGVFSGIVLQLFIHYFLQANFGS